MNARGTTADVSMTALIQSVPMYALVDLAIYQDEGEATN